VNREQADALYDQLRAYAKTNGVCIRMNRVIAGSAPFEFTFEIIVKNPRRMPDQDTLCRLIYNFATACNIDMRNCLISARHLEKSDNEWWEPV